jgi:hypothetical protein
MANKEFVDELGKNPSKCIRCVKPWFGSWRCVIADAGFASIKCAEGLAEHGLYMIGNVKGAITGFPKKWMLGQLHVRGDKVCASWSFKTSNGQEWTLSAAGDKDKQPMTLLGNACTRNMGEAMQRAYGVLKADGTFEVMKFVLDQWAIHFIYRRNFNAIDMHNSKRQGLTCFEDRYVFPHTHTTESSPTSKGWDRYYKSV